MGLFNPVAGIQRKTKSVGTIRKENRKREGGGKGERVWLDLSWVCQSQLEVKEKWLCFLKCMGRVWAKLELTSWKRDREKVKTLADFIFLGSKITADGDCSHEIKMHAPWKKSYDKTKQH